jgi:hypothetical protein
LRIQYPISAHDFTVSAKISKEKERDITTLLTTTSTTDKIRSECQH